MSCTRDPASTDTETAVAFTSTVTGGVSPYTFDWDWDDETAHGTTEDPSHTYTVAGSYSPLLTVTDACGRTVTCSPGTITVGGVPDGETCATAITTLAVGSPVSGSIAMGQDIWFAIALNPAGALHEIQILGTSGFPRFSAAYLGACEDLEAVASWEGTGTQSFTNLPGQNTCYLKLHGHTAGTYTVNVYEY